MAQEEAPRSLWRVLGGRRRTEAGIARGAVPCSASPSKTASPLLPGLIDRRPSRGHPVTMRPEPTIMSEFCPPKFACPCSSSLYVRSFFPTAFAADPSEPQATIKCGASRDSGTRAACRPRWVTLL